MIYPSLYDVTGSGGHIERTHVEAVSLHCLVHTSDKMIHRHERHKNDVMFVV